MSNNDLRNLIALEAEKRIGMNRFDLNYKCEETCAEGVTDVLNTVGNASGNDGFILIGSTSCNTMYANMTISPFWYEPDDYMTRGDIIFFDWDRIAEEKPLDHVGIVLSTDENNVTYANINGSNHNNWTIQTMSKTNVNIAYWLRYLNPIPETNLTAKNETPRPTAHSIVLNDDIYNMIHRLQELRLELDSTIQKLFEIVCKNK